MKIHSKTRFFISLAIIILLILSYFIKISDYGSNYETQDSLLGIIIFHNPIILSIYSIILLALIFTSFKKIQIL